MQRYQSLYVVCFLSMHEDGIKIVWAKVRQGLRSSLL